MPLSRADARDTGATLLIRGDGALGVETPAHKEGQETGRKERRAGEEQKERRGSEAGQRGRAPGVETPAHKDSAQGRQAKHCAYA